MPRRRSIKVSRRPAIIITRRALGRGKLVYLAVANKSLKYPSGYRSKIVYIGTTKKGARRIAASAAAKAKELLDSRRNHGIKQLDFHVVTCTPLRKVKTWEKLERAFLLAFKDRHWSVPIANTMGKHAHWADELDYFKESRLRAILLQFQ